MLSLILLIFAFVFFTIAVIWSPAPYYPRLVAAGLACWVAAQLATRLG